MADPANTPVVETTPVVAAPAAPAGAPEVVAAAPAVEPAAAAAPVVEPAKEPVVEAAPAAPAKEPLVGETPSLLEETKAAPERKPADTAAAPADKPKEEIKAADAAPKDAPKVEAKVEAKPETKPEEKKAEPDKAAAPAPAPEPIKYEFKLPDVIKDAPKEMGEYTTILGEAKVPAETGQKLLDLHALAMTNYAKAYQEQALAAQHKVFNDMRADWRGKIKSDPELGGAGYETTSRAVARMRDLFVPESDRKSFDEFLRITGAGDHPALWRMLHRAARYFDEPAPPPPGAKPTKTNGQRPGANVLYDNPRSNIGGQQ